jgi:hypothetical protein
MKSADNDIFSSGVFFRQHSTALRVAASDFCAAEALAFLNAHCES